MMLWHARLVTLKGFYQSSVLVSSENREDAILMALEAIRSWHSKYVEDSYFSPVVGSSEDDEDYSDDVDAWMEEVRAELEEKLLEVEGGALVMHSI